MPSEIEQAKAALKSGQIEHAQAILAKILKQNQRDDQAWTLLAHTVDSIERKRECLKRALSINPGNGEANQLLASLTDEPETTTPLAALTSSPAHEEAEEDFQTQLPGDTADEQPGHSGVQGSGNGSGRAAYHDLPWEQGPAQDSPAGIEKPPFEFGDVSFFEDEDLGTEEETGAASSHQERAIEVFPDWMTTAYDPEPARRSTDWMFPEEDEETPAKPLRDRVPDGTEESQEGQSSFESPADSPYWLFPEDVDEQAPLPVQLQPEPEEKPHKRRSQGIPMDLVLEDGLTAGLVGGAITAPLPLYALYGSPSAGTAFIIGLAGVFLSSPLFIITGALAALLIHRRGWARKGQAAAAGAAAGLLVGIATGVLLYTLVSKMPGTAIIDLSFSPGLELVIYGLLPVLVGTLLGSISAGLTAAALRTPIRRRQKRPVGE